MASQPTPAPLSSSCTPSSPLLHALEDMADYRSTPSEPALIRKISQPKPRDPDDKPVLKNLATMSRRVVATPRAVRELVLL